MVVDLPENLPLGDVETQLVYCNKAAEALRQVLHHD
jgi:hypothetical protein